MKRSIPILLFSLLILTAAFSLRSRAAEPALYARSHITDETIRYAYDRIREAMISEDPQSTVTLDLSRQVDHDALVEAVNLFLNDNPACFWLTGGFSGLTNSSGYFQEVTFAFSCSGDDLKSMRKALAEEVDKMTEGVSGNPWEMALLLHDRLIDRVTYTHSLYDQTSYGALVERKAVCTGYAAAYQLLLNKVGIAAYTVVGEATNSQGNTEKVAKKGIDALGVKFVKLALGVFFF